MATVLITGAAGYIGSHLADALVARGDLTIGLDNFDPQYDRSIKERNLEGLGRSPRFVLVEGDIRDRELLRRIMREYRPEAVVHLAAKAGVRESLEIPQEYVSVNVEGTLTVLEACVEAGVPKVVFGSSSSVYGPYSRAPFSEDEPVGRPASPYAATKVACEAMCHVYHHLHGLSVVVTRIFNPIGPRQRPGMALDKFTRRMLAGEPIPIYGDGSSRRDYTYIGDTIRGLIAALDAELGYEVINIGHSQPVALRDLIATMERVLGVPAKLEYLPEQPGDVPLTYADITKAEQLLGWQPTVSLEEAVEEFVAWYREVEEIEGQEAGRVSQPAAS